MQRLGLCCEQREHRSKAQLARSLSDFWESVTIPAALRLQTWSYSMELSMLLMMRISDLGDVECIERDSILVRVLFISHLDTS